MVPIGVGCGGVGAVPVHGAVVPISWGVDALCYIFECGLSVEHIGDGAINLVPRDMFSQASSTSIELLEPSPDLGRLGPRADRSK